MQQSRILAVPRIAALAFALAGALPLAAATGAVDADRNFDARAELALAAPPVAAPRAAAIEQLRSQVPDLLVSSDYVTGATRTLNSATGLLTAPRAGDAEEIALDFVWANLDLLGLSADDLGDYEVVDRVPSARTGVTHLYLGQRHDGIPVYSGQLHVNVAEDGRILSVNNLFVPNLALALNTTEPVLGPGEAVAALARHLGTPSLAARPTAEPQLRILAIRPGEARLVWNFDVDLGDHWYDVTVDAVDGKVWTRIDWVADASYRVYETPVEAPSFGSRTLAVDPQDTTASPFGWHDTNGAAGAEFTTTQGNNAHAYTDTDANNTPDPGSSPDGGGSLVFDFPLDLTQPPSAYRPAAVTNLFYFNNVIHDVAYQFGFDEAGGNFQENNYGNGGLGSDYVQAEAQDGSGTNNANFATPPDGQNPRMQMYIWTAPNPDRDGDLDNGIITHEYGHGISNRLVGGPANTSCLSNAERPSEGLSDWWSMYYTFQAGNPDVRGIGTYALNQATNGVGIRAQRYDKAIEPNTNTWTYASLPGMAVPHGVGSVWAQAYWYVLGRLEDEHGFDADIYDAGSGAGNIRAMEYIIEGLKNTVCNPGFVDVRDGILAAAASLHGGEDVCRIWQAFADFGLGFSASQGSPNSTNDQTPAFDIPAFCQGGGSDYCSTAPVAVPDNTPAGLDSSIVIADTGTLADLDVQLTATHTWVGDLIVRLTHVNTGTSVTFYDRPGVPATTFGCSGDNLPGVFGDDEGTDGTFENDCLNATPAFTPDGHYTGNNPLSPFDGEDLSGTWTLTISDNAQGDSGVLTEWCLVPETGGGPTPEPDIAVDPATVESTQAADTTTTVDLDISNEGDADLTWAIEEGSAPVASSLVVLHENGPFVTHPGGGSGGADASQLQTALGLNIFGFGAAQSTGFRVADDFEVTDAAGWDVDTITFYSYQTGSTTTSTLNNINYRIWDGPPGDPSSTVVFGDTTTNRMVSTAWTNSYRVTDTDTQNNQRPVMSITASGGFTLPQGTYWVDFQIGGTLASGPWAVPISIVGQTVTGNGKQFDGAVWNDLIDTGTAGTMQGLPFRIDGDVAGPATGCDAPTSLPWASTNPSNGTTAAGATTAVEVTFDSTGLAPGTYEGTLCIDSNDPDESLVEVPVSLTVLESDPMPFLDGFETGNTSRWSATQTPLQSNPALFAADRVAPN